MNELLPCPFCGGEARTWKYSHPTLGEYWRVACNSDLSDCCISGRADTETEAIEAWNTRAIAYENDDYFYLPKPKEDVAHAVYSGIEKTDNGYKVNAFADIIDKNVRKWSNELDEYLIKRMCEVWNPERTCTMEHSYDGWFTCSECNNSGQVNEWDVCPNYCPNCGAKVVSE